MGVHRSKLQIMGAILSYCKTPHLKTNIMYRCDFAYTQLNLYLTKCLEEGLLTRSIDQEERVVYTTTAKGIEFLNHVERSLELAGIVH